MTNDKLANDDFEYAMLKAFWRRVTSWMTGQSNELLPFDEVRERLPLRGQHSIGLRQVEIDKIIGSIGRYRDFDRAFLPLQSRTKGRWVSIDKAHYEQIHLPPVELYKLGEVYFVKDGNHRVSVARERGQEFVDAYVIEIEIPVPLTADLKVDDLLLKQEYAIFLEQTALGVLRPQASFETKMPGQYALLLEHIAFHRWQMGKQRGGEVPLADAAAAWYDHVYLPLVEALREQGVLKAFQNASETDLYLWVVKYQWYLREAYKDEPAGEEVSPRAAKQEAARQLAGEAPPPMVRKLINVLKRADWVDALVLKLEQTAFLEQTRLAHLRPEADVATSVPGQYARLVEHIAVHRWYLGEQRHAEVPYAEAVASWYDHVYLPLVELLRQQGGVEKFPDRTETDLYLWVIEHQALLQAEYGEEVSLEDAARILADQAENGRTANGKPGERGTRRERSKKKTSA